MSQNAHGEPPEDPGVCGLRRLSSGVTLRCEEREMAEGIELDGRHRVTVEKIFRHPVSHNIQWHDVLSLLQSVATVTAEHDGRYAVTLGSETETLDAPRHHDIDEQMVIDLRRILRSAGITPESTPPTRPPASWSGDRAHRRGALLQGLGARLQAETGMRIVTAPDPLSCVAIGAGQCLEEFEILKQVLVTSG